MLADHERIVLGGGDEISTIAVLGHVPPVEDFPEELHGAPYAAVSGMYAGTGRRGRSGAAAVA